MSDEDFFYLSLQRYSAEAHGRRTATAKSARELKFWKSARGNFSVAY